MCSNRNRVPASHTLQAHILPTLDEPLNGFAQLRTHDDAICVCVFLIDFSTLTLHKLRMKTFTSAPIKTPSGHFVHSSFVGIILSHAVSRSIMWYNVV